MQVGAHGRRVLASSLSGSDDVTVATDIDALQLLWPNGTIYAAFSDSLQAFAPPEAWRRENQGPFDARDFFVNAYRTTGPYSSALWVLRVRTSGNGVETAWLPASLPGVSYLRLACASAGVPLLIIEWSTADVSGPVHETVVDLEGHPVLEFPQIPTEAPRHRTLWPFYATWISSDGYLIVGFTARTNPIFAEEARMHVADIEGKWIVPVAPATNALYTVFSPDGQMLAFEGLDDGRVHVGTIEVTWPQGIVASQ
ncbi:MAG: hypothetical protein U0167_03145 [bacterium]